MRVARRDGQCATAGADHDCAGKGQRNDAEAAPTTAARAEKNTAGTSQRQGATPSMGQLTRTAKRPRLQSKIFINLQS
jgi:hypothetical protein